METIQERVTTYTEQWQDYCLPDKIENCKPQVNLFIEEIDQLLTQNSQNKKQKAKLYYLKGKVLDLLPVYEKSAEEVLNKSIKLNGTNGDCWNVLAHVLFKKKDYQGASKAINMALQTKGKNKISLRYQSILLRTQAKIQQQRRKNVQQSVNLIKQALIFDMKDWVTWYFLGNAYFSNFVTNFKKIDELENAVKAYNQAEKYLKFKHTDLYLNRANVKIYLEQYQNAIIDLKAVHEIDQTMGAKELIDVIQKRMEFTKVSFQRVGEIKKQKLQEIVKTIPNKVKQDKNTEIMSIAHLSQRDNPNKMLSARVMVKLTRHQDIPTSYLVTDNQGKFLCVSVYNAKPEALDKKIQKQTLLSIKDPLVKKSTFEGFSYSIVQVFDISKMYIEKIRMSHEDFNPNVVVNQTFEK